MYQPENTDMLLWLDLEATGPDEFAGDEIVEIACVLTTVGLEEVAAFTTVVRPSQAALSRLMALDPVREMHEENGLLDELAATQNTLDQAAAEVMAFLEANNAPSGRTVLAGSGVSHFDCRFIRHYLPELEAFLRYWMIDIGVVRRMYELWVGELPTAVNEEKTHRALDDVYCHLEEARTFIALWGGDISRLSA